MVNFCSDNVTGAAPQIMAALQRANEAAAADSYGEDDWTARVEARLREIFETDLAVFPVATGSAANALGLSLLTPPYGAVYCHPEAHINVDECGAPELFSGGAKLVAVPGAHAKMPAAGLAGAIHGAGVVHHMQPAAVSLSQVTEAGTLYGLDEIAALTAIAGGHRLGVQMDGARFANALVALGCTPAEMTWKAGVDVLAFGATKNGAFAAEAVVLFDPAQRERFGYLRKRGGHLFSKMRFLSAQLEAYLADDLWLANARHANAMAAKLSAGLAALPEVALVHPTQANMIFARLPTPLIDALLAEGHRFYRWPSSEAEGPAGAGEPATAKEEIRLVVAFNTPEGDVEAFLDAARRLSGTTLRESA